MHHKLWQQRSFSCPIGDSGGMAEFVPILLKVYCSFEESLNCLNKIFHTPVYAGVLS